MCVYYLLLKICYMWPYGGDECESVVNMLWECPVSENPLWKMLWGGGVHSIILIQQALF